MTKYLIKILKILPFVKRKLNKQKGITINQILFDEINCENPIIIDVGANTGQTIENYLQLLSNPKIYSFEPTSYLFKQLKNKYNVNSLVNLFNLALSDSSGVSKFFESDFSPTNSLLEPNIELYEKFTEGISFDLLETLNKTLRETKVKTIRFDEWYKNNLFGKKISIFKTDTQGFDFEVLLGSSESLINIKFIIVETQFQEFYKGSKPFYKTYEFLYGNGFYLYNLSKKNHTKQIFECDALFINSNFSNL